MAPCPACGAENREGARFCDSCGKSLLVEPPAREVRKTVTVLFADVTGSTALGERLDPESLRRVMARYFEAARTALERHGGTVEKFIGDAVMAVFGVPSTHEDDALRAVRAAAELQEAIESLNAGLERDHGVSLQVRVGVNTGEVVTGTEERLATGDAVNVAARLEQAASPGAVLLGEQTRRLVRDAVEVEAVDPLAAKGKAEPVPAFRLLRVLEGAPAFERQFESPLVGRERELAVLRQAFDRAVSERGCHLFTVLGAAGVGKSRLVLELTETVADQATVVTGRCLPYGEGITFWPLIELFRAAGAEDELEPALAMSSAEETFWAVRKTLERRAAERPLVVILDDLHWGEPTFLDLVEHVADLSRDAPILLVCVARPELLDLRPGWAGGKLNATSVLLEPLNDLETEQLIANVARTSVDPRTEQRILEAAEGNPLFVEEMLAMLQENGREELDVPPTIQALLAARLDRLGGGERQVIERAAVEGRVFHRGAVVELSPEPLRPDVAGHLLALVRKELVRPGEASFPDDDAFRFRHLLIRDAAYESLPKEVRADLHERFATWLEGFAGRGREGVEEIIGYHFEQAHRYRIELGPLDEAARELGRRAAERLGESGRRARARDDFRGSAKLLRRAVDVLAADDPRRLDLLPDLVSALTDLAAFDEANAVLQEGLEAAASAGDRRVTALLRVEAAMLVSHTDPGARMRDVAAEVEQAIEILEEYGDDRSLAKAWTTHGVLVQWLGAASVGATALERARDHAQRAGDRSAEIRAMWWQPWAALTGTMPADQGAKFSGGLAEQLDDSRFGQATTRFVQACFLAMLGRFDEARSLWRAARAQQEDLGLGAERAGEFLCGGQIELLAGDADRAAELLRSGRDHAEAIGETGYLSTVAATLAEALYRLGRADEALQATELSERTAAADDVWSQMLWRSVRAKLLARSGSLEPAEELARVAVAIGGETDYVDLRGNTLLDLSTVLVAAGKPAEARIAAQEALELYELKGNVVSAAKARAASTI